MSCLDENALGELVEGRLSAEQRAEVDLHLDACAACRDLFAAMASAADATSESGAPPHDARGSLRTGDTVGRFVVLGVAGGGGMGVVYSAYDPELDRKIALKFLRPSESDCAAQKEMGARMEREAKAMARLSHPNVVAVYDVGIARGEVYVAMEYVEGTTLAAWLRADPRTWREILGVFLGAGTGLAAAHAAGIVHRDFKPDNVLVGADGRVRVTDFGLAHTTGAPPPLEGNLALDGDARLTRTGAVVGTPAYMAPEQIEGHAADARTDLFSFCVALSEALYGERPFPGRNLDELRAAMKSGSMRPVARATETPAWLRREVLRGLRNDPNERHPSMQALLDLLARGMRLRRRRTVTAGAALGVVAFGLTLWGAFAREPTRVCRGAEEKLARVWDDERKQTMRAAFLAVPKPFARASFDSASALLDAYARDWVTMHTQACEATRVTGEQSELLLDLRIRCLEQRRQELGALTEAFSTADAALVTRAAQAVRSLGRLQGCADVAALTAPIPLPADAQTRARVEALRQEIARAKAFKHAGRYRQGADAGARLVERAKALGYRPVEAEANALWAEFLRLTASYDRSAKAWRATITAATAGRDTKLAARGWAVLAWVLSFDLTPANAEIAMDATRHAAALIEGLGGDPELEGVVAESVGGILLDLGRYDEAFRELEGAVAKRRTAFGRDTPEIATLVVNMGVARTRQARHGEAAQLYAQALAIQERELGGHHPIVGHTLFNLADAQVGCRRFREARTSAERALGVLEGALGPEHPLIASALNMVGIVANAERRFDDGRRFAERAVAMGEKLRKKTDVMIALYYETLGNALTGLKQFARARAAYEHAKGLHVAREGMKLSAARVSTQLGRAALDEGAATRAVDTLREALRIRERERAAGDEIADTRFALARALRRTGSASEESQRLALAALDHFLQAGAMFQNEVAEVRVWLRKAQSSNAR